MERFKRVSRGFDLVYEEDVAANETIIVELPPVSPNKRGVDDIGWQTDGDITLYGTLASNPEDENTLWQEIKPGDAINNTVSAFKIVNGGSDCRVVIRTIMR